ncbi:hypothetical protein KQ940_17125 [Marinobacterium sp. D7]|uniref:hypothetical protein n=1 Tax=Marinobacterium ramblicola TaxID=2849041 RepID=UPI001C2D9226|nr:hypothetical protein [Marinobacterium ramblicola]MBV1789780.1 hypothetical protein [Marinobacterium ramblicola]
MMRLLLITLTLVLLQGCATNERARPFELKSLAKSDIDMVTDQHILAVNALVRELTIKLYKRNPRELKKAPAGMTLNRRLHQLLDSPRQINHAELGSRYGVDAMPLVFDPEFKGDRVFALMIGISGMLHAAYSYRNEFFLLDEIDQQKLYNSARNLEAVAWRLNNLRTPEGELFLLTNGIADSGVSNLSFERIFGKLIAYQDMMAKIVANKTNRAIKNVVVGFASTALLPI